MMPLTPLKPYTTYRQSQLRTCPIWSPQHRLLLLLFLLLWHGGQQARAEGGTVADQRGRVLAEMQWRVQPSGKYAYEG